jgi:hypothetical protein
MDDEIDGGGGDTGHFVNGIRSFASIATELNLPVHTVQRDCKKAMDKMRKRLAGRLDLSDARGICGHWESMGD